MLVGAVAFLGILLRMWWRLRSSKRKVHTLSPINPHHFPFWGWLMLLQLGSIRVGIMLCSCLQESQCICPHRRKKPNIRGHKESGTSSPVPAVTAGRTIVFFFLLKYHDELHYFWYMFPHKNWVGLSWPQHSYLQVYFTQTVQNVCPPPIHSVVWVGGLEPGRRRKEEAEHRKWVGMGIWFCIILFASIDAYTLEGNTCELTLNILAE